MFRKVIFAGHKINKIWTSLCILLLVLSFRESFCCEQKFEGFGVFLGSNSHFSKSIPGTEAKVLEILYEFLGIRYFRTSYEESFSPEPDKYEISCTEERSFTCSWITMHQLVANLSDVKVFASVWSPPHYMKNNFYQLMPEYETAYLHFLKNITLLVERDFNIRIEKVSPVNEPENLFAPWDHTNMSPDQLCRIIRGYNDSTISLCPENSYFWVSKIYYNFDSDDEALNCSAYCDTHATHAYALNLDFSSENSLLAYYDLTKYNNGGISAPIWMTEASSTYRNADQNQMTEALDLATSIINFLGTTCIQRYYFWYAYTRKPSGESLIWGNPDGSLFFPKKFFTFKLFLQASNTTNGPVDVNACDLDHQSISIVDNLGCLQFGDVDRVLVNRAVAPTTLNGAVCKQLCCMTESEDLACSQNPLNVTDVPARSVCHCVLSIPIVLNNHVP